MSLTDLKKLGLVHPGDRFHSEPKPAFVPPKDLTSAPEPETLAVEGDQWADDGDADEECVAVPTDEEFEVADETHPLLK